MPAPSSFSLAQLPLLVTARGEVILHGAHAPTCARAILPGSFNPIHAGHWALASAAARQLGHAVAFELSLANVDKPALAVAEVERRLAQFAARADIWITPAPRFVQKAEWFPGATFIVGADTALRLVQPRYYDNHVAQMLMALEKLSERHCRFLVAGRCDAAGRWVTLADLPVPSAYRSLFAAIPAELFRCDVSSTMLRNGDPSDGRYE